MVNASYYKVKHGSVSFITDVKKQTFQMVYLVQVYRTVGVLFLDFDVKPQD